MYKHIVWFFSSLDTISQLLKAIAPNNKIICENVISKPTFDNTTKEASWRKKNWGTTEDVIEIIPDTNGFSFVSESYNLLPFILAIAKKYKLPKTYYKYAGLDIKDHMRNVVIENGIVKEEKPIHNDLRFFCSVWNIDVRDACDKLYRDRKQFNIAISEANVVNDDDMDIIDSILDGEE